VQPYQPLVNSSQAGWIHTRAIRGHFSVQSTNVHSIVPAFLAIMHYINQCFTYSVNCTTVSVISLSYNLPSFSALLGIAQQPNRLTLPTVNVNTQPRLCYYAPLYTPCLKTVWTYCCKWPNYDFCISQGSVATVLRWGGQNNSRLHHVSSWCCMPKIIKIGQCFTESCKE